MFGYRFADQAAFQLWGLIPLVVIAVWWTAKRTRHVIGSKIQPQIARFLMRSVSARKRKWKLILQCLTLFFFVFALARPQSGQGKQKAKSEGLEMVLAVDVSNSMLAEDERPSRLELAKHELDHFLDTLGGDKVGLVAFAGSAVLLSPMTTDKSALKMYIDSLSTDAVSTQGTDFKRALSEAYNALQRGGVESDEKERITKVIVVASDGEENEEEGLAEARKIAAKGVRIFTLGFGTAQGGRIPMRDQNGNLTGYKKDRKGQEVITRSTGASLKALAQAGQGTYQQVTFGGDAVGNLKSNIDQLQRAQFDTMEFTHYNEHYQQFLFVGILFALIEIFLGERKSEGRLWRGRFEVPVD